MSRTIIFNTFKLKAVPSNDPNIGHKQPGGACIGVNRNSIGAIVKSGRDKTGLGSCVPAPPPGPHLYAPPTDTYLI
eukprot:6077329-Ditylum_brightwellii.AAC.1